MRTMHPTLLLPALQLTATVLLAIAPFVSATTPTQPGVGTPGSGHHSRGVGLPDGWEDAGCRSDDPSMRTLTSFLWDAYDYKNMTVEWCTNYCNDEKKALAGLEDGNLCFCGNIPTPRSAPLPDADCLTQCDGNKNEYCGGKNSLSLYWNGIRLQDQPTMPTTVSSWPLQGCFKDSNDKRTLTHLVDLNGPNQWLNSAEYCIQSCKSAGYSLAGMEFAVECWCGKTINYDRVPLDEPTWYCMLACPGNSLEICGGPNTMTIYGTRQP